MPVFLLLLMAAPGSDSIVASGEIACPDIDTGRMLADLDQLCTWPTRFAASNNRMHIVTWLETSIDAAGAKPRHHRFRLKVGQTRTTQANLFARVEGRRRDLAPLLLVAHYDTINEGWTDDSGRSQISSMKDAESPATGADDNGSGVVVLLEVMRALVSEQPARDVVFLFTAAEEMGQKGSQAWLRDLSTDQLRRPDGWPLRRPALVVNVDQIGLSRSPLRCMDLFTQSHGAAFARRLRNLAISAAPAVSSWNLFLDDTLAKSDHGPFLRARIPAISLHEGKGFYPWEDQGAGDVPDKLDPVMLEQAARLLTSMALDRDFLPRGPARPVR